MSDTTLMTSVVESPPERSGSFTVTRISISGEPHVGCLVDAVNAAYPRPDDIPGLLASLDGQPVTIMRGGENMLGAGMITAVSAKLFNGGTAYLPKGKRTKGFRINPDRVLDVVPGYNQEAVLAGRLAAVRARFPQTAPLTAERLVQLPAEGKVCSLGVFGKWRLETTCYDAVWLLHSYQAEDDIVEGVLFVRPEVGVSEYGSIFGRDLLRMGGEIVGLPQITFAQALEMTGWDHDRVLELVRGGA